MRTNKRPKYYDECGNWRSQIKLIESNEAIEVVNKNNFIDSGHCNAQGEDYNAEDAPTCKEKNNCDDISFNIGDHVYHWCSFLGVPYAYQHHGIVVEVSTDKDRIKIVNFGFSLIAKEKKEKDDDETNEEINNDGLKKNDCQQGKNKRPLSTSLFSEKSSSSLKMAINVKELNDKLSQSSGSIVISEYTTESAKKKWRKVMYHEKNSLQKLRRVVVNPPGTVGINEADFPGIVVARAIFLLHNPKLIPPYHLLKSNCECVAVWCKTGNFSSLQGNVASSVRFTSPSLLLSWTALEKISDSSFPSSKKIKYQSKIFKGLGIINKICGENNAVRTKILNEEFTKCNLKGKYLPHYINSNHI